MAKYCEFCGAMLGLINGEFNHNGNTICYNCWSKDWEDKVPQKSNHNSFGSFYDNFFC